MAITVAKRVTFNSAHRLYNPHWDNETNDRIFGLCNNPNFHGHNYDLIIKVKGPIDPITGFVVDVKELKELAEKYICHKYDHTNLNLDHPEFNQEKGGVNPTVENIAKVCYDALRPHLPKHLKLSLVLYETPRNYVEYDGEE
jgi:6-pyruvoyltetrahydropterin/6-carboxytetrahydropterin synthase